MNQKSVVASDPMLNEFRGFKWLHGKASKALGCPSALNHNV